MTIKGTFPLFYNYCHSENHDFWKGNLITDSLNEFIGLVDKVLSESSFIGPDEFHSTAKLLIDDILASKLIATKQELEILNFLQFYYSEASASYLSQNGLFTQVHDWLVWSVSDQINYGVEVTFQLKRIGSFFESKISLIVNNRTQSYIHWMTTLFYYSRHQGGLKELSKLILDEEHFRLTSLPKNNGLDYDESEALHLLCQALAWSIDNQESKGYNFAELIKDWIPNLSSINQKSANLQLATGGAQFTKENSEFYAKQVIDKFSDLCKGHELLHAQCIYYAFNLDELDSNPDSLKHAFEIYGSSIGNISNISKKYEKGRIFGILRGLVMTCLKNAKAKLAFYLLSEFYEKGSDFNNHLFFALNIEKQICSFISENRFSNGHELSIDEYRNLIKISNKFLGTKISLQDDPHFILEEPKYLGLPDKDFGIQFEEALSSYYSLNCLNKSDINDFESLIVIPGHQHPVQALLAQNIPIL